MLETVTPNYTASLLSLVATSQSFTHTAAVVDKPSASPSQDTQWSHQLGQDHSTHQQGSNISCHRLLLLHAASTTASMTILFAATVPAVLIVPLVTITIVIVVLVIAFIWRKIYKSSHIVQHPVGTSDEHVELQNVYCTIMPSFKDKQQ